MDGRAFNDLDFERLFHCGIGVEQSGVANF